MFNFDEPAMLGLKNLGLIVIGVIVLLVLTELSRIPERIGSKKAYSNLSGRVMLLGR